MTAIQYLNPPELSPKRGRSSHVVKAGDFVFIAGQIADDKDGNVVGLGDPEVQGRQAYANLARAVRAAGGQPAGIVQLTIYVTNRDQLPAFRAGREEHLAEGAPAVTVLVVSSLFRPEYLIELQATAYIAS